MATGTGGSACGRNSPRSRSASPGLLGLPGHTETGELLEQICAQVSEETTAELVDIANSTETQHRMQDLLPVYFYSWQLQQPAAIIIYLLLQFFLVKRDCSDLRKGKEECESHIYELKQKIGDLEEQLLELRAQRPASGGAESPTHTSDEISKLVNKIEELNLHNQQLETTKAELYDINQQWANDYNILEQRIANTSGCYSANSTGTHLSSIPIPCIQCRRLERELDESKREIEELTANFERTREELQQSLKQRSSEIKQLENENRAIHFQLQELGDLQHAMKVQEEHGKLQHQYAQLKKEHQNGVAERLQLGKQLEKVRKAFIALFPFSSGVNGRGRSNSGYNTVPKRSCRRQHYSAEPPTPPGLIARGDNRGSLVEKDLRLRMMHDQQVTSLEAATPKLDEPRTWPGAVPTESPPKKAKPSTLFPVDHLKCPCCQKTFAYELEDFNKWFDHIQFCSI